MDCITFTKENGLTLGDLKRFIEANAHLNNNTPIFLSGNRESNRIFSSKDDLRNYIQID